MSARCRSECRGCSSISAPNGICRACRAFIRTGAVIDTGRQFVDTANTEALPDWARLALGLRDATVIEGRKTTFRANVLTVTGASSRTGVASFGTFFTSAPRTDLLSMSVDL